MDEAKLIEKLRLIEALFSGTDAEGERVAAGRARERILERLRQVEKEDPPLEYRFPMGDMWSRKVFTALLRRYGIRPYRYKRQRYTTVMARVSKRFVDETLWPEFEEFAGSLEKYLSEVTDRVVSQVICRDSSEAEVVSEPPVGPVAQDLHGLDEAMGDVGGPPPPSSSSQEEHSRVFEPAKPSGSQTSKNREKRERRKKRKRR